MRQCRRSKRRNLSRESFTCRRQLATRVIHVPTACLLLGLEFIAMRLPAPILAALQRFAWIWRTNLNRTPCCVFSPSMAVNRGMKTGILPVPRNWSPRFPPAVPATTCTRNSAPTSGTECASTWCGGWDSVIDWFALREGRFQRLPLADAGHYQSEVFPGLWLDPAALVRGDVPQVMAVLQQGLASPEHAAFVARLQAAAK